MIYHVHLVNGHQLVTEISNKSAFSTEYNFINPMMVSYINNSSDATFMLLRPYIFDYISDMVSTIVHKSHVVSMHEVDKDFYDYYIMSLRHNRDFVNNISKKTMLDVIQAMESNYIEKSVGDMNQSVHVNSSNNTLH